MKFTLVLDKIRIRSSVCTGGRLTNSTFLCWQPARMHMPALFGSASIHSTYCWCPSGAALVSGTLPLLLPPSPPAPRVLSAIDLVVTVYTVFTQVFMLLHYMILYICMYICTVKIRSLGTYVGLCTSRSPFAVSAHFPPH